MSTPTHLLYETALGYSLFSVAEAEGISIESDSVQAAVLDLARFGKIVKLANFLPFRSAEDALENINAISEGIMHPYLQEFLENDKSKLKKKALLGVADAKIGQTIKEKLSIECSASGVVPELLRGVRQHFTKMVKAIKDDSVEKAQLGLGHSYSRAKVKFNVHRSDNMIIQAICLLDQLDKDINTFSMRLREWYSYHFPELVRIVPENGLFAQLVILIGKRTSLTEEKLPQIEQIVMSTDKAQQVLEASKTSMGMDISEIDLESLNFFAKRVAGLTEYRKSLHEYLTNKMHNVAPNLAELVGEQVGARLISHAGSLTNLAKYPASTVQILGAEKALFRALKSKGNTPKYGLIYHSTFIGRAGAKNKGRISRFLANKCSIASRIDCFSDISTPKFGEELKSQVEERLGFYESGEPPRKNVDVMKGVIEKLAKTPQKRAMDVDEDEEEETGGKKKKKEKKEKKDKKDKSAPSTPAPASAAASAPGTEEKKKKKKKNKDSDE